MFENVWECLRKFENLRCLRMFKNVWESEMFENVWECLRIWDVWECLRMFENLRCLRMFENLRCLSQEKSSFYYILKKKWNSFTTFWKIVLVDIFGQSIKQTHWELACEPSFVLIITPAVYPRLVVNYDLIFFSL